MKALDNGLLASENKSLVGRCASEISLSSPVSLNEDIRFRNDWLKAWIS